MAAAEAAEVAEDGSVSSEVMLVEARVFVQEHSLLGTWAAHMRLQC